MNTISQRQRSKHLHTTFLLSILMLFFYGQLWAQFSQIGNDIMGEAALDQSGFSISMPNIYTIAIGAPYNDENGLESGHVRVYSWNGTTWVQKGMDMNGEAANDQFGFSVSMPDANTVAIGARNNNDNGNSSGHVRIYSWNGSAWVQKGLDINGEASGDCSGWSVSMPDANTVAIGARYNGGNGTNSGHVRIYSWNGTTWVQKGMDIDGEASGDQSGWSVNMPNNNMVAIGAYTNDGNGSNAGHVRIYSWNGTTWVQKGMDIDGEASSDLSGSSVSMPDTNTIAIGAPQNSGNLFQAGHVRIYSWNGLAWVQKGMDIDGEAMTNFSGYSVSMPDVNTVAIGAYGNDGSSIDAGHVRIYSWNGFAWGQKAMDIDGAAMTDFSGFSVSMPDAHTVGIGAYGNDENGPASGQVRVYGLKGAYGYIYQDFNQNCFKDVVESPLKSRLLTLNPGNIILQTNDQGFWNVDSLPVGTYTITADTSSSLWQVTCPITQSFTITNPDSAIEAPSYGYISNYPCTRPDVSIYAPFLRRGFFNQRIYVQVCNTPSGSSILDSAYTIVELDPLLMFSSSSMPYTNPNNNQYRFYLGNLSPSQCVDFWLSCYLSLNAIPGQTLCMNAKLYPVDSCSLDSIPNPYPTPPIGSVSPCTLPWDRSSLRVEGSCVNDSIRFVIYNTGVLGGGDMDCFAPVRIYVDGTWILLDSIQLQGGDSIVFMFAGDGRTWRLEADQHPLHPGNSHPNVTVELCGNAANWTSDLVNIFPHDDADPIIDIYCGLVTGSYDPNDKTGYPLGVGSNHDIEPNQDMEYVIRFQNTGTDTAFTVVIRDTLSTDLDIFSVRSGASSHDYTFRMYGPRVLEWTFNNIMLPDYNVNLIGSNGFVNFKVRQMPNLPVGTVIENSASIYFDFNAPIFTNTSWHTIDLPQDLTWDGVQTLNVAACEHYSFNNLDYDHSGTYWQVVQNGVLDSLYTLNLTIDEMPSDSITLSGTTLTAYAAGISYQWLDCNNGNAPIAGETNQSFTPLSNGNYAVEMTDGTCTIVSNCLNVTGVVVEKLANDLEILIYPNPTTGILHLEKGNDSEIGIEVLDNLGRVLLVQTSNDLITNINLSHLPAGVYYISIGNGKEIVKEKIIKQ